MERDAFGWVEGQPDHPCRVFCSRQERCRAGFSARHDSQIVRVSKGCYTLAADAPPVARTVHNANNDLGHEVEDVWAKRTVLVHSYLCADEGGVDPFLMWTVVDISEYMVRMMLISFCRTPWRVSARKMVSCGTDPNALEKLSHIIISSLPYS